MQKNKFALPLFEFFHQLRASQSFSLGMEDYFILVEALQKGFGVNEKGELDKKEILELCSALWLKPNQSFYLFENIFNQSFKFIQDTQNQRDKSEEKQDNEAKDEELSSDNGLDNSLKNETNKGESENNLRGQENDNKSKEDKSSSQKQKENQQKQDAADEILRFHVSTGENQDDKRGVENSNVPLKKQVFQLSDDYYPLDGRKVQQIWRSLPIKSSGKDTHEINLAETIQMIAQKGYVEKLHYQKSKKILNRILFLADHQGSMVAFEVLRGMIKASLETAFKEYNQPKNKVETFYFYNVPQEYVYRNHAHTDFIAISKLIQQYRTQNTAIIILSDAGAARASNSSGRVRTTIRSLFHLQTITSKIVWLNPMPKERWENTSAERIARFVQMLPADESGIQAAVNFLKGKNANSHI